jgi:hypothetical protein
MGLPTSKDVHHEVISFAKSNNKNDDAQNPLVISEFEVLREASNEQRKLRLSNLNKVLREAIDNEVLRKANGATEYLRKHKIHEMFYDFTIIL